MQPQNTTLQGGGEFFTAILSGDDTPPQLLDADGELVSEKDNKATPNPDDDEYKTAIQASLQIDEDQLQAALAASMGQQTAAEKRSDDSEEEDLEAAIRLSLQQ